MSLIQADVYGEIVIYVKYTTGIPAEGILFYIDGQSFTTDAKGRAAGKFSSGQHTVIFNGTLDMEFSPQHFRQQRRKANPEPIMLPQPKRKYRDCNFFFPKNCISNRVESFDAFWLEQEALVPQYPPTTAVRLVPLCIGWRGVDIPLR